jgi:acyl-CoA thioesterase-1
LSKSARIKIIGHGCSAARTQEGLHQRSDRPHSLAVFASLMIATVLCAACGDNPTRPSTPAPTISCPAPLTLPSGDGSAVIVNFSAPQVVGGATPVTTTCDRQSGTAFPVGTSQVSCVTRDAQQRTAACTFAVNVVRVPQITATRFLAFGDSITEGAVSSCARVTPFMSFGQTMSVLQLSPGAAWTYPAVLQSLLRDRYAAQLPAVSNRGIGGESTATGATRLPGALAEESPEVVLIQEGANDINQNRDPASIASDLRTMVRSARGRGARVYLGTLLPQQPIGVNSCRGYGAANVTVANILIRSVAATEGATLVDLYQAFGGVPGDLIGPDGLHPTEAGYRQIAQAFFTTISSQLER